MKKIAVAGTGYVGLSVAILLAQYNDVVAVDVIEEKVNAVNNRISPIQDEYIEKYLAEKQLNLTATLNAESAYKDAEFIVIATPTNYDTSTNFFDTHCVEDVLKLINKINPNATIIIKSTVPVGFTKSISEEYNNKNIIFSPEFLRETKALYDNLYPSRIIMGINDNEHTINKAHEFAKLLQQGAIKKNIDVLFMGATEAEAVKLFANTYLAMRVSFFNELDTYSEYNHLNTKSIIDGVCLDPRIGTHYNNPSFGYGGYCLPKDTKQLLANYYKIPQNIISAVVKSNDTRKNHISQQVIDRFYSLDDKDGVIGIYRLTMKSGSDNFRDAAIQDIISQIKSLGINIVIYEPTLNCDEFFNCKIVNDFNEFKKSCCIILANRYDSNLDDVQDKIYTRDIFMRD